MSNRRGLSVDEKRRRALNFFYERKVPFTMKELEGSLSKHCQITSMSVKEIIKMLSADKLIEEEKVGTNQLYWSFPSQALKTRNDRVTVLKKNMDDEKAKGKEGEKKRKALLVGRELSDERKSKEQKLQSLRQEDKALENELSAYSATDPDLVAELRVGRDAAIEAKNRWIDNIVTIHRSMKDGTAGSENPIGEIEEWAKELGLDPKLLEQS